MIPHTPVLPAHPVMSGLLYLVIDVPTLSQSPLAKTKTISCPSLGSQPRRQRVLPSRQVSPGTSLSALASSSTIHGPVGNMIAEGKLPPAIALLQCLHSKSKRSLTPSRWLVGFLLHVGGQTLTLHRRWKFTSHPKSTRTSSNEHALLESMAIVLYCKPLTISWRSHST
jgi:hypothetical protein